MTGDWAADFSSEAVTGGIRVRVEPRFDPARSRPQEGRWFFIYTVTIRNESTETVQLLGRHWIITDGTGHVEEVRGAGVVGEQPVLSPGQDYRYSSGCPLMTAVGAMEGSYSMVTGKGVEFDARIAPFTLCEPGTLH
jgi:ApaG protein